MQVKKWVNAPEKGWVNGAEKSAPWVGER